jgi:hypothetical protein
VSGIDQNVYSCGSHLIDRLPNGRKLRPSHSGDRSVIESRDGELSGHRHVETDRANQDAQRKLVVGCKNGGRSRRAGQKRLAGRETGAEREVTFADPIPSDRKARFDHGLPEPSQTLFGGAVAPYSFHKRDVAVAKADEMCRHIACGGIIVHRNDRGRDVFPAWRDANERHIKLGQQIS